MFSSPHMESRLEALTPRLTKYARRYATPVMPVDDLVQNAREEILTNCSPQDNDTYMLRLADWRMKNAVKRESVYAARIIDVELESDTHDEEANNELIIVDMTGTPEEEIIQRDVRQKIRDIDGHLTPDQRLILAYLADSMSQHEIARVMKTSQPRIRYHILKIRELFSQAGLTPSYMMA